METKRHHGLMSQNVFLWHLDKQSEKHESMDPSWDLLHAQY